MRTSLKQTTMQLFNILTKYLVVYKMANGVSNIIWTDPNGIKYGSF